MPTIEENRRFWNDEFLWGRHRGDIWSKEWGGPEAQWHWCIYPRIRRHLPAGTVLEIGSGMGRWTGYLLGLCERLIGVDISERCVEVCRRRFPDGVFHQGDGRTLAFLADQSIDFVFSFESLIHTELDDLACYLGELQRVMRPGAFSFIHHSNLAAYGAYFKLISRLPDGLREALQFRGILDFDGWRATSVSAGLVRVEAAQAGLTPVAQELLPWGGDRLIDCFSTLCSGPAEQAFKLVENPKFVERAREIQRLSRSYRSTGV